MDKPILLIDFFFKYLEQQQKMSQTMFEIRRVFQQRRTEISKVADGFSITNSVRLYGIEQLLDSVNNLLAKEKRVDNRGINL